ncbi:RHS repeat-associated core domain-containing protein [Chromobacterium violaceum]|uniref:RHS repeat-associated core domain-containing protein n=1 Tax=Chromobacterium violaceum TaxID=536 RepID=UPI001C8B1367|nr:RHS repeat-associated core domain-containing protein [Chromobacterium violaceum]MBX9267913.1 RHS repeat-associated core domain-containing protein [Chromobacterium violaceum]
MSSRVVGFNGERLDPVGGAIHLGNGHRAYEPVLKRFDQPDSFSPFGRGGINPYAYCAGDPVNRADPSGHMSWQAIAGIASGVVGLALIPFTLGQSLTAAACVLAGLETASGLAAILSGALEDTDPKISSALGWAALAAGAASIGGGLARAALSRVPAGMARAWLNGSGRLPRTGARALDDGYVALGKDIKNLHAIGSHGIPGVANDTEFAYLFEDVYKGAARLNVIAHGRMEESGLSIPLINQATGRYDILGPEELAFLIKQKAGVDYDNYQYARLVVCRSADVIGGSIFAQNFADYTGLTVKAYSGQVRIARDALIAIAGSAGRHNFFGQAALDSAALNERFLRLRPWFGGDKEFFRLHPDRVSSVFSPSWAEALNRLA